MHFILIKLVKKKIIGYMLDDITSTLYPNDPSSIKNSSHTTKNSLIQTILYTFDYNTSPSPCPRKEGPTSLMQHQ